MSKVNNKSEVPTVKKKSLFLKLQFSEDIIIDVLNERPTRDVRRMYNAVNLCLSFTTRPVVVT